jgi:hypothetical protein
MGTGSVMREIGSIVVFLVLTGAFFWSIDLIEMIVRSWLRRRRTKKG